MWYIQVDNNYPVKMEALNSSSPWSKKNIIKVTKWHYQIKAPESLNIFYICNQYNVIKGCFNVTIQIGALKPFYLGQINTKRPSLQSEPNFPIQRGTKCFVIIEQNMENPSMSQKMKAAEDKKKYEKLKNSAVVHSFNEKFDKFMDALQWYLFFYLSYFSVNY